MYRKAHRTRTRRSQTIEERERDGKREREREREMSSQRVVIAVMAVLAFVAASDATAVRGYGNGKGTIAPIEEDPNAAAKTEVRCAFASTAVSMASSPFPFLIVCLSSIVITSVFLCLELHNLIPLPLPYPFRSLSLGSSLHSLRSLSSRQWRPSRSDGLRSVPRVSPPALALRSPQNTIRRWCLRDTSTPWPTHQRRLTMVPSRSTCFLRVLH